MKHTPERINKPGLKNVRCGRIMEKGMVITVEPGCYFRDFLINGDFGDKIDIDVKCVNVEKVKEY